MTKVNVAERNIPTDRHGRSVEYLEKSYREQAHKAHGQYLNIAQMQIHVAELQGKLRELQDAYAVTQWRLGFEAGVFEELGLSPPVDKLEKAP